MEACDHIFSSRSIGTSDSTKFLVIKQNLKTKLNESLFDVYSKPQLRNILDLNKKQYDYVLEYSHIDVDGYRYVIMYVPSWMSGNL